MTQLMHGAVILACATIGLIFLRFWRRSHDRLFVFFAVSFWLLGMNWLALAFSRSDEPGTLLYAIRLAALVVILIGIWDKNRTQRQLPTD